MKQDVIKKLILNHLYSEYPPYIQRDINGFYNEMPSNFKFTDNEIYMGEKN